jgi:hypothetical protein
METKYKAGEIVFDRIHPSQKLVVSHHQNNIYYCKPHEHRHRKLVYFERDLMAAAG